MKKILHVSLSDICSDSRILKEMDSLAEAGYILSGVGVKRDDTGRQSEIKKKYPINSLSLRSRKLKYIPSFFRYFCVLVEFYVLAMTSVFKYKPHMVHCHDYITLPIGFFAKLLLRSKVVYDAHELESETNGLNNILKKLIFFFEKVFWRVHDGLIVVSPSIADWYGAKFSKRKSTIILNSPVTHLSTPERSNYLREHFSIPRESKIFIYVGMLIKGRGVELIADAFQKKDTTASLVFLGYGILENDIRKISEVHKNIYLHEAVSHEEVVSIVKSADYGLCLIENISLSDYYCLPNKLFEYCFSQIPVLASNFPDISALVERYNLGVCCDLEQEKIQQAINFLEASDYDTFYGKDVSALTWKVQAEKLVEFYRDILCENKLLDE